MRITLSDRLLFLSLLSNKYNIYKYSHIYYASSSITQIKSWGTV